MNAHRLPLTLWPKTWPHQTQLEDPKAPAAQVYACTIFCGEGCMQFGSCAVVCLAGPELYMPLCLLAGH